jgi:hypothetical protein
MAVQKRHLQAWFGEHWLRGIPEKHRVSFAEKLDSIRLAAETVIEYCPPSPEQSRAITRMRDQVDELLLEIWVAHLPENAPWSEVYFGEHWLSGFRDEEKPAARQILFAFRRTACVMNGANIQNIRAAWQAAMRALRCFA